MILRRYNKDIQSNKFFEDHIFCFVHIPKTAGSSFINILQKTFGVRNHKAYPMDRLVNEEFAGFEPDSFRSISGHFTYEISRVLKKKPMMLTILRHPVSRAISQFHEYKRAKIGQPYFQRNPDDYGPLQDMQFEDFIQHPRFGRTVSNLQTRYLGVHARRPINTISDLYQTIPAELKGVKWFDISLELAKERLEQISFLGIQEHFQDSMDMFSYQFGIYQNSNYPMLNKTHQGVEKSQLAYPIIEKLTELNQLDVQLYEFAKSIFNQRYNEMKKEFLKQNKANKSVTLKDWLRTQTWPNQEMTRNFNFEFEALQSTAGWHDSDIDSTGESWTWSGPDTESAIDLPLDRTVDLQAEILIENFMAPDILNKLKIEIDGKPMLIKHSVRGKKPVITTVIPSDRHKPAFTYTNMKFFTTRTIRPCDVNPFSKDPRFLGIAIKSIEIRQI